MKWEMEMGMKMEMEKEWVAVPEEPRGVARLHLGAKS